MEGKLKLLAGNRIKTSTDVYFDLANPTEDTINIEDIAHALSNIPRWGGHAPIFYSVAQHSLHCLQEARKVGHNKEIQLEALMHDAHEAYLLDMPKPIKDLLPDYQKLESKVDSVLRRKFGMKSEMPKVIKDIDYQVLVKEWNHFTNQPDGEVMIIMDPKQAFLDAYRRLT
jgi:5'-deoxynucleotidase YfbR-like HD superfamily hydrolase